jgi:cytosine/adenosine deaminase-related metal-dependent hydrolase/SAM-dependent methyltransferase
MTAAFLFINATVVFDDGWRQADLRVRRGRIREIGTNLKAANGETVVDCAGRYIYPGLINAHDHLEFNLYPRLGEPPYPNVYDLGRDLHRRWSAVIGEIQNIPLRDRLHWGAWKNLFSGVTTVLHHNHYYRNFRFLFPVCVHRRYTYAHSLEFEPDIMHALRRRKKNTPFMIHLAEGIDERAFGEVERLARLGGFDRRTAAIHAIALNETDIDIIKNADASVVWCPSSNMYLYGQTAPVDRLLSRGVPVALGTDSTLTGGISMFDEFRDACRTANLKPAEIFRLATSSPRRIFGLRDDAGSIIMNGSASFFILPEGGYSDPYHRLIDAAPGDIDLLMRNGNIVFHDRQRMVSLNGTAGNTDGGMDIQGRQKVVAHRDFAHVYRRMKPFLRHYTYLDTEDNAVYSRRPLDTHPYHCPSCRCRLIESGNRWKCTGERLEFGHTDGIPDFILPGRRERVDRFVHIYRTVRSHEQWGSEDARYYELLPFEDITGRHSSVWKIRSATYETFCRLFDGRGRSSTRVLDAGAGNGWLSSRLARRGYTVAAADVNTDRLDGLKAVESIAKQSGIQVQVVIAEFDRLPFPEKYFDHIIFNASLHYAEDPMASIGTAMHFLADGGTLWILDSPVYNDRNSGEAMIAERISAFREKYGITIEPGMAGKYLTYAELDTLKDTYQVETLRPDFPITWKVRPLVSKLLNRREPASFDIVSIRKRTPENVQ